MTDFRSGNTRVYWTCKALLAGRTINHQTEIREVRGWRLGAIIHRLRIQYGWPILVEYVGRSNVALYRLDPDADLSRLRFPTSAIELRKEVAA